MSAVARSPSFWIKRGPFPRSFYHVRAWGSERFPDLNYQTSDLPTTLHHKYPFIDIQPIDKPDGKEEAPG